MGRAAGADRARPTCGNGATSTQSVILDARSERETGWQQPAEFGFAGTATARVHARRGSVKAPEKFVLGMLHAYEIRDARFHQDVRAAR